MATIACLALSLGTIAVATTSAADASQTPRALATVTIGTATTSIVDMPIWVAQTNGYYAQHNLNVKWVALSAATELTVLLSNSIQFLAMTTADFLTSRAENIPIQSISDLTKGSPLGVIVGTVFAQAHGITAKTPLKTIVGDLVGTTGAANSANIAAQMHLFTQYYGVQPSQYTLATVSNAAASEAALEKNQAQWILLAEPVPFELQAGGFGTVVASSATIYPFQPSRYGMGQGLTVTNAFATADPGITREFVAAMQQSVRWLSHHELQSLPIATANLPGVTRSILLKSLALIDFPSSTKENANLWRTSIAFGVRSGQVTRGTKMVENVDWTNKYF